MPWTCCDATLPDSNPTCPACGSSKRTWSVRFDRTRVFSLKRVVEDDWELEAIEFQGGDEASDAAVELDEEWELEALEHPASGADGGPAPDPQPSAPPARKAAEPEDDDWELEALEHLLSGAEDNGPAVVPGGQPALATRSSGADEDDESDDDWELEQLVVPGEA